MIIRMFSSCIPGRLLLICLLYFFPGISSVAGHFPKTPKIRTITESRLVYQPIRNPDKQPFMETYFADEIFGYSRVWFNRLRIDTVYYITTFDSLGNRTRYIKLNENNDTVIHRQWNYQFDAYGRIELVSSASSEKGLWRTDTTKTMVYSGNTLVTKEVSSDGNTRLDSVVFDAKGRQSELYTMHYGVWWLSAFYAYDGKGRPVSEEYYNEPTDYRISRLKESIYYGDSAYKVIEFSYERNEAGIDTLVWTKTYDALGNLLTDIGINAAKNITRHYEFDYDTSGFMIEKTIFHREQDRIYELSRELYENKKITKFMYENYDLKVFYTAQLTEPGTGRTRVVSYQKYPVIFFVKRKTGFYRYWKRYRLHGKKFHEISRDKNGNTVEDKLHGWDYGYWSHSFITYTYY